MGLIRKGNTNPSYCPNHATNYPYQQQQIGYVLAMLSPNHATNCPYQQQQIGYLLAMLSPNHATNCPN